MENKKQSVLANVIWKFAERIGAQVVTLVVSIILARILDPEHYGSVSIVLIFINIANVFVANGFTSSLIQKKDPDNLDFSTIFYFNILFSIALYCLIFVSAPYIEQYFQMKDLCLALRILGLKIPITAFNAIQQAYVAKHMLFRKLFWATLGGTIVSAVVGIWMAYQGFGVFALVGQYLTNGLIDTVMLWFIIKWRPIRKFSFKRFKELYTYGWKNLLTYLVRTLYDDIYSLVIGKKYSSADLAYYTKGKQYPNLIVGNVNTSLCSVLFPAFAKYQEDLPRLKESLRKSIKLGSYVLSPFLIGMAACAEPMIELLLTDKWLPCVPFLQMVCLYQLLIPVSSANLQVIKSMGRGNTLLKLEIIKRIVGVAILLVSMQFGVYAIAVGAAVSTVFNSILDTAANSKLLNYSYKQQIKDIFSGLGLSLVMGICVYSIRYIISNSFVLLGVQVIVGVTIFVGLSHITKNENYQYLLNVIKSKRSAKKTNA